MIGPYGLRARTKAVAAETLAVQRATHKMMRWWRKPKLKVWYDPAYRIPLPAFEAHTGAELRRADLVAWFLDDCGLVPIDEMQKPTRIGYRELGRVHTREWLESCLDASVMSRVFAVKPEELVVEEMLRSIRTACAGTLEAARFAWRYRTNALNLLGGFHHAEPHKGGGFCVFNDIAVAIATLRAEGLSGAISVLDLDAHPPDGTAACCEKIPNVWIGSISGQHAMQLPNIDEIQFPSGTGDVDYLRALSALLNRMPPSELVFVLAGGDVLKGDPLGGFSLSFDGIRRRDAVVADRLKCPSVWLPGGGYQPSSWRVLASTAMMLAGSPYLEPPQSFDPLHRHFSYIARYREEDDRAEWAATMDDVAQDLGIASSRNRRLLGYYTPDGIEMALEQYGILPQLERLGYHSFDVEILANELGDVNRIWGMSGGKRHLLIESVTEKQKLLGKDVLYVHWLTLRHPRAVFSQAKPKLPGQDAPGLGMAREASELLEQMAKRLGLSGVAFTPAYFHTAYAARKRSHFVSPARQARFEAMIRDLGHLPLQQITIAVSAGHVLMDNQIYQWEATPMVCWLDGHQPDESTIVDDSPSDVHFTLKR